MRRLSAAAIAAFACFSAMAASAAESPLRVAVYVGTGASNIGAYRWLEIASTAGNVVATPVDGETVRAGALDDADVLIMPGGGGGMAVRLCLAGDSGGPRRPHFAGSIGA